MSEPVVNSQIVIPCVQTFFHLTLVKVSIPLFFKHGSDMLNKVMTDMQRQDLTIFNESTIEIIPRSYHKAHEALLFLPAHLRLKIIETVNGIQYEVNRWMHDHYFLYESMESWEHEKTMLCKVLYFRSDGTIDRIKTSQELVLNKNISISLRFKVACKYCLRDRIKFLWSEMVASGKTENYEMTDESLEKGWIEWILAGNEVHWTEAVLRRPRLKPSPRYSSFFFLLHPELRNEALSFIDWSCIDADDLRFCLCAMTNEEKDEMVKMDVPLFLSLFVRWPFQNFFIEMAVKLKNYIDYDEFDCILEMIMAVSDFGDFDYCQLIVGFWNIFPDYCEEFPKDYPEFYHEIHQFIEKTRFSK